MLRDVMIVPCLTYMTASYDETGLATKLVGFVIEQ